MVAVVVHPGACLQPILVHVCSPSWCMSAAHPGACLQSQLERQRKEDCELEASLGCVVRPSFQKKPK